MASKSLITWRTVGSRALDEIESAHRAVGGTSPGRRYATEQINHAYVVLLSSQFQRFCRDLHSEAADAVARPIVNSTLNRLVFLRFTADRRLDRGNPGPAAIGADFHRFNLDIWTVLAPRASRNKSRQQRLETLNAWRNAIAHHDFDPARLGGRLALRLIQVRAWRRVCDRLAVEFDAVLADHVATITGRRPW